MTAYSKIFGRILLICFLCVLVWIVPGCRQSPSTSPKYYQREIEQMQSDEELRARRVEPPVKDWYPWRGKPPYRSPHRPQPDMPQRIDMREQELKVEIDYLNEVVRGKKKVRLRFRD